MASLLPRFFFSLLLASLSFLHSPAAAEAAAASWCPRREEPLLFAARELSRCAASIESHPAVEVNGEILERELDASNGDYHAILFYASWCPFSQRIKPIFDELSAMFPRIAHLAVEESSVTRSILSRYGVRSFPSIRIACGSMILHLDSKDFLDLIDIYITVTGQQPVAYLGPRRPSTTESTGPVKPRKSSFTEAAKREPYLAFSLLFISLRTFVFFFPKFLSCLRDFWSACSLHVNLGIVAKPSQLLECVLHVVDVRKTWSKARLLVRAKNAKVWASSLASMSLGGSSSPRPGALDS